MGIIIFILIAYGLANAIIFTSGPLYIFDYFRGIMNKFPSNIGHGYECMICFPFQIGILLSIMNVFLFPTVYLSPMYYLTHSADYWYINMILDGAVSSGSVWILHTIQESIEKVGGYFEFETLEEQDEHE